MFTSRRNTRVGLAGGNPQIIGLGWRAATRKSSGWVGGRQPANHNGAAEKTRTSTHVTGQRPQRCASTNSATAALEERASYQSFARL